MQLARKILKEDLKIFRETFKQAVKSHVPLLDSIMHYIVRSKGKQLRPMFVLLCARLVGKVNIMTYRAASLVELLHTATLVHDDVVDDAMQRRAFFSINALWKNKIAVLVGDYLLSKGLLLSLDNNDFRILQLLSDAVRKMSEGELLQIEKTRKLNVKEDVYFDIIRNKTASLLASACAAGAYSATQNEETANQMKQFGEKVGIAFQIKDDLFDYGNMNIGKPTGNDIKEKKLTLPLIYTLNHIDASKRRNIMYIVKNKNKDKQQVRWVIDEIIKAGGMDYAQQKMYQYRDEALGILTHFPASDVRDALEELVRFTTDRKY